ncbi:MAG TPA: hypothetical protein VJQ49_10540 [Casimicrobiaceae bacterium]|nr:hypothetical protein [Casimicrobiaceae bacterium]
MRTYALLDLAFRTAAGALTLVAAPCALALSLGDARLQSGLGQPLRVAVPIAAATSQPLTAACVHVIADAAGSAVPPQLLTSRVTIDRAAADPALVVTTVRPIASPVVRLAVQAGCDGAVRRDYVLLLDPAAQRVREPGRLQQTAIPLSSPGGSSFIPEAAAAGLPRASSAPIAMAEESRPGLVPWWPIGAALILVGAVALWLLPKWRRETLQTPIWVTPTARTEPNHSRLGKSAPRTLTRGGHFAAMTEPGAGFPNGTVGSMGTGTTAGAVAKTEAPIPPQPPEDPRFAEFDADLIEERNIRNEWAKAVSEGAIDIGGDSILKAIDDAERALDGTPAPAQAALDRSLDDELLRPKTNR